MLIDTLLLVIALLIILFSAELFTNGVEWLGQRLSLSEGVVGSVLAAVGTALPETLIPVVAVLFFASKEGDQVGIGAIAGAPFMLSTLTLALTGWSMWYYAERGRRSPGINLNKVVLSRDLKYFIFAYTIAMVATLVRELPAVRFIVAFLLCATYGSYLYQTFGHQGEVGGEPGQLYLDRLVKQGSNRLFLIIPQVLVGLSGILGGAFIFVDHVKSLSLGIGIPAVVLSLIISPIATELPEKINSVLWARSGKDTLAMGNVTGALVFQSCFPVAFGIAFTHWALSAGTIATGIIAILCAATYLRLIGNDGLKPQHLMTGALIYSVTIAGLIITGHQAPH